ncbi:MAG: hypothetical protein H0X43_13925 [Nitrosospira sp.]|nr:hypothetical protein [Nitrosospira sp.]
MSAEIPQTFREWRHCIEHECGIQLTPWFIEKRLRILGQRQHEETLRFIRHYGEAQWRRTVSWFKQADTETDFGDNSS